MSSSTFAGQITNDPVINAESKVGTVIAICVSFSVASAFFVALRLYTRVGLLRYAGNDDITIVVAEVLALLTALGAGMGEFLPFTYLPVFPGTLPSGGDNCLIILRGWMLTELNRSATWFGEAYLDGIARRCSAATQGMMIPSTYLSHLNTLGNSE